MQYKIKIDGVDVSAYVEEGSLRIENVITEQMDTCELTIIDHDDTITIDLHDEIIVSNTAETVRYFAGLVSIREKDAIGVTKVYRLWCQDYSILVTKTLLNEVFVDMTDKQIVRHLFRKYLPEIEAKTSVYFDGVSATNRIDFGTHADFDITDAITIELWVKPTVIGQAQVLVQKAYDGTGDTTSCYYLGLTSDDEWIFAIGSVFTIAPATPTIEAGKWYHVVARYNKNTPLADLTIDTVSKWSSASYSTAIRTNNAEELLVGTAHYSSYATGSNAQITLFRLYDRYITDAEIEERYFGKSIGVSNLVIDVEMEEATGTNADDISGNNHDGTITFTNDSEWKPAYTEGTLQYARQKYVRDFLADIITQISRESGLDWYTDYYKRLHYFQFGANTAPFDISDDPNYSTTYPAQIVSHSEDFSNPINRVSVIGGTYWSDDAEIIIETNGDQTIVQIPYKLHAKTGETGVLIYKNTGTYATPVWTAQSVGIDYIDDIADFDCLYNFQEKVITFKVAPAALLNGIKIEGRYDVPVYVRMTDAASYTQFGRWYDGKIVNRNIDDKAWARITGQAMLAENAWARVNGNLICDYDGLFAGQKIKITNALRGIDTYYLIQRVSSYIVGGTTVQYNIEYGAYSDSLIDMLLDIKRQAYAFLGTRDEEEEETPTVYEERTGGILIGEVSISATATGEVYYCEGTGANDPITCGFWKSS